MKYIVMYKVFHPDGMIAKLNCMPENNPYFDNFKDAAEHANDMNNHLWHFHQDQAENHFYFVKEIQ